MNYAGLEKTICKVIKEQQIKIGYASETVRLYYPLRSLNIQLGANLNIEEMTAALREFSDFVKVRLGEVAVSNDKDRFCLRLEPKASEYVHEHTSGEGFMYDLISLMGSHGITMEQVKAVFDKYSLKVVFEKLSDEDFDYLIYFKDELPDEDFYCFKEEGHHITYHRFTKEDYRDLL